jgi:hypothetical protein
MVERDSVFIMPGNVATGGMPYTVDSADLMNVDAWPSEQATLAAFTAIGEIVSLGFEGIRSDVYQASGGRYVGSLCWNDDTPEGRLCAVLLIFASKGKSLPPGEALDILKRIYREQGLPLPTNKNAR